MNIEKIAKCCHEANRVLCESIGDYSQRPWDNAEEWQRKSAISGVEYFIMHPNEPDSAQHDAWSADKIRDGWVYGPDKDADKKTHPCLVPFGDLPKEQQAKDTLFKAVCRSLVPLLR